jgi:hypothetical protein
MIPPVRDGTVNQIQQLLLGGRLDPTRDPATQSQRPFPSASINLTPISLIASESQAISARAAASSGSGPPWRRERLQRALLADLAKLDDRRAVNSGAVAASAVPTCPRTSASQISYFGEGDRNRFARRPPLLPDKRPGSVIKTLPLIVPEASQMWANQNPNLGR